MTADEVDTEEFFNLCQRYRHAPLTNLDEIEDAYKALLGFVALLATDRMATRNSGQMK